MKILKELIMREIAGDVILVPVGKTVLENNGLFALNEVGADIWKLLAAGKEPEEIVEAITEIYDAPADVIRPDTMEFIEELIARGILAP